MSKVDPITGQVQNTGRWTKEEDTLLLRGVEKYGTDNWDDIANFVKTRTVSQASQHYAHMQKRKKEASWNEKDDVSNTGDEEDSTQDSGKEQNGDMEDSDDEEEDDNPNAKTKGGRWKTVTTINPATGQVENSGTWTNEENRLFLEGVELYGKGSWDDIASHVKSRNEKQVNNHYHYQKLALDNKKSAQKNAHCNVDGEDHDDDVPEDTFQMQDDHAFR